MRKTLQSLIFIGALLAGTPFINISHSEIINLEQRVSFEEAKSNPSRRQEYVKDLTKIIEIPHYLKSIEYSELIDLGRRESIYTSNPAMLTQEAVKGKYSDLGKQKIYAKTTIFPASFENAIIEKEFLIGIKHELNMAKIIYNGFDKVSMNDFYFIKEGKTKFNTTLFHICAELESYGKDIDNAIQENISEYRINKLTEHYIKYYLFFWAENNPSPKAIIEKLQKLFFREEFKKQPFYYIDENGYYLLDKKDRKYYLPKLLKQDH